MRLYIGCGTRRVTSTTIVLAILADTTAPIFSFLIFFVSGITRACPFIRYPFLTFVVPAFRATVLVLTAPVFLALAAAALTFFTPAPVRGGVAPAAVRLFTPALVRAVFAAAGLPAAGPAALGALVFGVADFRTA